MMMMSSCPRVFLASQFVYHETPYLIDGQDKYSLRYLLFILYSMICKYTCVNTRKSFRASIQEKLHQNV